NDASAFDGEKKAQLEKKGEVNNKINAFIMGKLEAAGIRTHLVQMLSDTESLVRKLTMIPVECVVRNVVAGSMSKRLGIPEGKVLATPVFEFFYKNDALHDPLVNDAHIEVLGWATKDEIARMKAITFRVNDVLKPLFANAGITLVDYKLEFGNYRGEMLLGDEFSPDGCRLWDSSTQEKMDKDRFRRDLGNVIEMYLEVARRIGVVL
ncbi:MAG: phosphoribosylaminoimidazolesuccinocarboxamide synthase, partial [Acidobacteriota bacterium]